VANTKTEYEGYGIAARRMGNARSANPYMMGNWMHDAWNRGWDRENTALEAKRRSAQTKPHLVNRLNRRAEALIRRAANNIATRAFVGLTGTKTLRANPKNWAYSYVND
jgi:hypothetical protein